MSKIVLTLIVTPPLEIKDILTYLVSGAESMQAACLRALINVVRLDNEQGSRV